LCEHWGEHPAGTECVEVFDRANEVSILKRMQFVSVFVK
jgi:hypothetical protein